MSKRRIRWQPDDYTTAVDAPVEQGYSTMQIAGAGARVMACLIDLFIRMAPQAAALVAVYQFAPEVIENRWTPVLLGLGALNLLYCPLFELLAHGQTPGKNICGIRVIAADGFPAGNGSILVRNLLRVVDWLPFQYFAGGVLCIADPLHRRFGDRIARTLVVYENPLREMLAASRVPISLYAPSSDGYILEAFLVRMDQFASEIIMPLAHQMASYFRKKYPPEEKELLDMYSQGQYVQFLQELYRAEKEAEALAAVEHYNSGKAE